MHLTNGNKSLKDTPFHEDPHLAVCPTRTGQLSHHLGVAIWVHPSFSCRPLYPRSWRWSKFRFFHFGCGFCATWAQIFYVTWKLNFRWSNCLFIFTSHFLNVSFFCFVRSCELIFISNKLLPGKLTNVPWKSMVGRYMSYWNSPFLGDNRSFLEVYFFLCFFMVSATGSIVSNLPGKFSAFGSWHFCMEKLWWNSCDLWQQTDRLTKNNHPSWLKK